MLRSQGLQANQQVEFFTDGAPVLRSLISYLSAESSHILDWFHLTVRLIMRQYALGLTQVDRPVANCYRSAWPALNSISGMAMPSGPWKK